jgi:hypothetical protein
MTDQRSEFTTCVFEGITYIRAHFWSTDEHYSTKICLNMNEAQSYILLMKAKNGRLLT